MILSNLNSELTATEWAIFFICALLVGLAKSGLKGIGLATIPIMAGIFGARASTGVLLPILIMADAMAVVYYRRHVEWRFIILLLPWVAAGIIIALITGNMINENQFRIVLTTMVIIMLVLMILGDIRKNRQTKVPDNHIFAGLMGIAGGFATMIGNSAGPVFTLYFLSMKLPKKEFIGTGAWLFLIVNIFKVPLHIFSWETISIESARLSLITLPVIAAGILTGIYLVRLFPEKVYRYFVIIATIASSFFLFI